MEEDEECVLCFDTGEYFNGKFMEICSCEAGDVIKESKNESDGDNVRETSQGQEIQT